MREHPSGCFYRHPLQGLKSINHQLHGFRYAPPLAKYRRPSRAIYSERYEPLIESSSFSRSQCQRSFLFNTACRPCSGTAGTNRHLVPRNEQHVVISKCEENGDWLEFSPPQRLNGKLRACTRFSGIHFSACCQTILPAGHVPA